MRETIAGIRSEQGLFVFLAAILVTTVIGPFGSYAVLSLGERFVFWTAAISAVAIPMRMAMRVTLPSARLGRLPPVARIALGASLAAVPGTGLVLIVSAVLWPSAFVGESIARTWFQVATLGFVIGCFHLLAAPAHPTPADPVPDPARRPRSPFLARLDPALGTDVVSLSMQDHYVEVTTTAGSQLLLLRFADALKELDGIDGLRLHRSHWAAVAHVECLGRDNGKLRVRLSDGRHLPVSQTYARDIRARLPGRGPSA